MDPLNFLGLHELSVRLSQVNIWEITRVPNQVMEVPCKIDTMLAGSAPDFQDTVAIPQYIHQYL